MKKFKEILNKQDLIDYFNGKQFDIISLESSEDKKIDYAQCLFGLKNKINSLQKKTVSKNIISSDPDFSEIIYNDLSELDNRDVSDIRFWQWLSLEHLQSYIWQRWWVSKNTDGDKSIPTSKEQKISIIKTINEDSEDKWSPLTVRFLGGTSLKSLTSRNAISRLFWPRKILGTSDLVNKCFEKQDIAASIFERQFGLHPEAARAFVESISQKHKKLDKKNIQLEAKKLNRYFATISPDYLKQDAISELLFL